MTEEQEAARGAEVVTRDEFALYDMLRTMSFFTFMMSVAVMIIGKCGLRSTWVKKSKMAKRIFRKGKIACAVIFVLGLFALHQCHGIHHIAEKQMHKHHEERMAEHKNQMSSHEFMGVLRGAKTTEQCKADHGKEGECNADPACVWCACSAVPSGCFAVDDAAKLPAAVFTCDKKEEAPVVQVASPEAVEKFNNYVTKVGAKTTDECKAAHGKEGECNADADCVWCACSAVPSGCFAVGDAAKLPSAVFHCDTKEEAPVVQEEASPEALMKFNNYIKVGKTSEECKAAHGKEGECNTDPDCVWCACSAVPSSCFAVGDAAKLPSAVFTCDTKQEDERRLEEEFDAPRPRHHRKRNGVVNNWVKLMRGESIADDECKYTSADQCNAHASDCSWCISAAVKPACRPIDMAKKLPASIFQCSNLSEEEQDEEDDEEPSFMRSMSKREHQRERQQGQREWRQGKHHRGGKGHHGPPHHGKAHRAVGPILLVIVMLVHYCNMRTFITKLDNVDEAKGYVSDWNPCQWSKKWNKKEGKKCHQKKVVVPQQQQQVSQSPVIEYAIYEHNDTQSSVSHMVPKETTMMV